MQIRKFSKSRQKGSALLIVMMMVILLTIMIMEISFSSQTAYSLAKNQIEKAQMNAVAESAFAYALNMVQIKEGKDKTPAASAIVQNPNNPTPAPTNTNNDSQSNLSGGNGLFSRSVEMDFQPDQLSKGPIWQSEFPVVTVGKIQMKLKISLEETKININRLVNSEDKVDVRLRSAMIEIFKKFEGTEEDVDRMIDYIDANQLGQYEEGAINAQAQTLGELLRLPNIKVKYSLKKEETGDVDLTTPQQQTEKTEEDMTLSDFVTVKSTGRININYANEAILSNLINNPAEKPILETIISSRANEPFKTLSQLSLNKTFGSTFKKMENYVTVDDNTFKVKVIVRSNTSFKSRIYIGYIFKSPSSAHYIMRTERTYNNDPELVYDNDEMPIVEDLPSDPNLDDDTESQSPNQETKKPNKEIKDANQ